MLKKKPRNVEILIPIKKTSAHSGNSNECDVSVAHTQNELKKKKKKKLLENKEDTAQYFLFNFCFQISL